MGYFKTFFRLRRQFQPRRDGSFNPADFSEDELAEMLGLIEEGEDIEAVRRRYFEEHDDVKDRTLAIKKWSE